MSNEIRWTSRFMSNVFEVSETQKINFCKYVFRSFGDHFDTFFAFSQNENVFLEEILELVEIMFTFEVSWMEGTIEVFIKKVQHVISRSLSWRVKTSKRHHIKTVRFSLVLDFLKKKTNSTVLFRVILNLRHSEGDGPQESHAGEPANQRAADNDTENIWKCFNSLARLSDSRPLATFYA